MAKSIKRKKARKIAKSLISDKERRAAAKKSGTARTPAGLMHGIRGDKVMEQRMTDAAMKNPIKKKKKRKAKMTGLSEKEYLRGK